ncbi:G2/mitotic-specific cyclin-B1 [Lathamus discolor]|uniref:G2/mitotic-specific cyclin-B1 n=1 Tax=Lathamus discolor TaxID=678569 RepID=UPI0032B81A91
MGQLITATSRGQECHALARVRDTVTRFRAASRRPSRLPGPEGAQPRHKDAPTCPGVDALDTGVRRRSPQERPEAGSPAANRRQRPANERRRRTGSIKRQRRRGSPIDSALRAPLGDPSSASCSELRFRALLSASRHRPTMSQTVSQPPKQPGRGRRLPVLRRPAAAGNSMRPSSRTVLVDIGNRVTEPKAQGATRNAAVGGGGEREPGGRPVHSSPKANQPARRKGRASLPKGVPPPAPETKQRTAPTEGVPSPAPEPKPEPQPQQLEPHSQVPMETPACAPSDDAACQTYFHDLLHVEDVVAEDDNCPEYFYDYAKDIYQYLRELEEDLPVRPKYLTGQEINGKMRAILIDWLVQVQMKFNLLQDTLYMSVAIIDAFLQDNAVSKKMLQLVGVTAMFIASKHEELRPLCAADLAYVTDGAYTTNQIIQMEAQILQALNFRLSRPLASQFLNTDLHIAKVNTRQSLLAKYLLELCIVDYDMVHFPPSKTAAAASCLSLKLLKGCEWTQTLQCHTSYTESDLLPVMQHIAKNVVLVNKATTKEKAIKKKYAGIKNAKISTIEQLNSPVILHLARSVNKKL